MRNSEALATAIFLITLLLVYLTGFRHGRDAEHARHRRAVDSRYET